MKGEMDRRKGTGAQEQTGGRTPNGKELKEQNLNENSKKIDLKDIEVDI